MKPKIIKKPWGWEEIWADRPNKYLGKTININMKESLPFQYSQKKEGTFYIVRGVLVLYVKNNLTENIKKINLGPGQCYNIPPRTKYKLSAEKGDVSFVEASTYFIDDIIIENENYDRK